MPEADTSLVEVIQEDRVLTLISIPPFVLGLKVGFWPTISSSSALSSSGWAIVPMSTDGVMIVPIGKPFKDILGFDEVRSYMRVTSPYPGQF